MTVEIKATVRASFVLFLVAAAAPAIASNCAPPTTTMARTELLFGASRVSDAQWKRFLAREVTPRFPNGLTAFEGYGQWKSPRGAIRKERSRILLLWHLEDAFSDSKIEAIRTAY